jgi:predicted DNA-binding protein
MCKTERLQIRITPELKAQLQALADADGRTVSNYIEQLIKQAIETPKAK